MHTSGTVHLVRHALSISSLALAFPDRLLSATLDLSGVYRGSQVTDMHVGGQVCVSNYYHYSEYTGATTLICQSTELVCWEMQLATKKIYRRRLSSTALLHTSQHSQLDARHAMAVPLRQDRWL